MTQLAPRALSTGALLVLTLVAWQPAAGMPLPAIHTAPTHVVQFDPLPLEPVGPDYLPLPPFLPMVIPGGMDAVAEPAECYHWEAEFHNPSLIPFDFLPAFTAVLVVPGDPPGLGRVAAVPALGPDGYFFLTGPELHFFEPLGPSDTGAFSITVTSTLGPGDPIEFDMVLIEWDSSLSDPPGTGSGGTGVVFPPAPIPPGPSVTFEFVVIPEPGVSVALLAGLALAARRRAVS